MSILQPMLAVAVLLLLVSGAYATTTDLRIPGETPIDYPWRTRYIIATGPVRMNMGLEGCQHAIYYKHEKVLDTGNYTPYTYTDGEALPIGAVFSSRTDDVNGNVYTTTWTAPKAKLVRQTELRGGYALVTYKVFAYDNGKEIDGGKVKMFIIAKEADFGTVQAYADSFYKQMPSVDKDAGLNHDFDFEFSFDFDDYLYLRDNGTVFGWDGSRDSDKLDIPPQTNGIWGIYFSPKANESEYAHVMNNNEDKIFLIWNNTEEMRFSVGNITSPTLVGENETFNVSFIVFNDGNVNITDMHVSIKQASDDSTIWEGYINLSKDENRTFNVRNLSAGSAGEQNYVINAEANSTYEHGSYSVLAVPNFSFDILSGPFILFSALLLFMLVVLAFIALYVSTQLKKEKPVRTCTVCGHSGEGGKCPVCGSDY